MVSEAIGRPGRRVQTLRARPRLVAHGRGNSSKRVTELGVESSLKPGTYTFAGGTSLDDIIARLAAGPEASGDVLDHSRRVSRWRTRRHVWPR